MSGTSADGVDIACCDVNLSDGALVNLASTTVKYPENIRRRILDLARSNSIDLGGIALLSSYLGEFYADSVEDFLAQEDIEKSALDLVGSHGQTVAHLSQPRTLEQKSLRASLQIGEAERIAKRLGVVTVSDFRAGDIAAGGSGAPLAPIYHQQRFAEAGRLRLVVNIGGIANLTLLDGSDRYEATDCGPGNCLTDYLAQRWFDLPYDEGGALAASGSIDESLFEHLQATEVFSGQLPHSLDRGGLLDSLLTRLEPESVQQSDFENVMATAAELTVWSIRSAFVRFLPEKQPGEVLVCGGGVHNEFLMNRLRYHFRDSIVCGTDRYGSDPDYVEAEAFAWLANLTIAGVAGNLPKVTGATMPAVLGKISLP
jgi:anhydro-N-acetylmuramic acid kinase